VQLLLQQMQQRFQSMSDTIIGKSAWRAAGLALAARGRHLRENARARARAP
jgi:hypothetical protein